MTRWICLALLLALALCGRTQALPRNENSAPHNENSAQADADTAPTFKLATKLVAVTALVLDKHSSPVSGLKLEDFELLEDDKPQPIKFFSQAADRPLTLALMVDTSTSQTDFIDAETRASRAFFPAMLTRPEDRAMLIQFDTDVLTLRGMTNAVDKLQQGLDTLADPHTSIRTTNPRGGTLLYDAIGICANKYLGKEQGRRAMVLLTDGGDNGSILTLRQAVAQALDNDVVIYAINYTSDSGDYGARILGALATTTGGRVFTVSKKLTLEAIYAEIENDMRLSYQLAYRPAEAAPGTYHHIELKTHDKHQVVHARLGYFTPK